MDKDKRIEPSPQQKASKTSKSSLKVYLPLAFALTMIVGMQIGYKMYENLKLKVSPYEYQRTFSGTETINEVFNFISAKYVDSINNKQLSSEIINEALNHLDPHSEFIPAKELSGVNEILKGNLDGIGIEFAVVSDTIVVVTALTGGPAEKLGVLAGDKIVEIEDSVVAGKNLSTGDVIARLKGKRGTKVKIGIKRSNRPDIIDFEIVRDRIPINSLEVAYMLDKEVGYIKLNRFSATTYQEFGESLVALQKQGMQKLILDLRQNPGGYLEAATQIADELIGGKNLLLYTEGRSYNRKDYFSKKFGAFEDGDLSVLIDQGSASASEILAGAIQDLNRGKIVGRRSFGKGLVQEQHQLSDGSALRLTVARYYTPSGRSIQKPYDNGEKAYDDELGNRFENGELFNQDSIPQVDSLKYKTIDGRTVFGGGGIIPDIYVPLDSSLINSDYLIARSFVSDFVYKHFSKNQEYYLNMKNFEKFKTSYSVDDNLLAEFFDFLKAEKIPVKMEAVKQRGNDFKNQIKAYVARQLFKNLGYYSVLQSTDEILNTAYTEIKDGPSKHLSSNRLPTQ